MSEELTMSAGAIDELMSSAKRVWIAKFHEVVMEELLKTSPSTGHGKAQRAFAHKIFDRLEGMK